MMSALIFLSACSSGNSGSTPSGAGTNAASNDTEATAKPSGEKVVIRSTIQEQEMTPEMIAEFEKTHPNIKIERIDSDHNKLMAMMAAGNAPELIRAAGVTELPDYVLKDIALDLTPYFGAPR